MCLVDQDCFASERGGEKLLALLPGDQGQWLPYDSSRGGSNRTDVVSSLRAKWQKDPGRSSEDKWMDLDREIKAFPAGSTMRVNPAVLLSRGNNTD
jgi:DNA primase small subunit